MKCINLRQRFGDWVKVHHEESHQAERPEFRAVEEPWLQIIPCRHGDLFPWGGGLLAASTATSGSAAKRLKALPGVEVVQDGSDGAAIAFPVERFDEIAQIVKARRRRRLSSEARARAMKRLRMYQLQPAVRTDSEARPFVSRGLPDLGTHRTALAHGDMHTGKGAAVHSDGDLTARGGPGGYLVGGPGCRWPAADMSNSNIQNVPDVLSDTAPSEKPHPSSFRSPASRFPPRLVNRPCCR